MRSSFFRIAPKLLPTASIARAVSSAPGSFVRRFAAMASTSAATAPAVQKAMAGTTNNALRKRPNQNGGGRPPKKFKGRKKNKKAKAIGEGSNEEILMAEIQEMLAAQTLADDGASTEEAASLPEQGSEIEVHVVELSSTGDGLALQKGSKQIYVVPYTIPGDTVRAKVYRHLKEEHYSQADLISVVTPSPQRDDTRIKCQYFGSCPGCQFQMLDYAEQLRLKRRIVEKAYARFSQLPASQVPSILDTAASPLQYGYRTKLTPHFDGPPGYRRSRRKPFESLPAVGFTSKGNGARRTLDIEVCPIGTEAVLKGMNRERERMKAEFGNYTRGATILLRESTKRYPNDAEGKSTVPEDLPSDAVVVEGEVYTDVKTCITDNNATSTEYIDDYVFTNSAGAFFQNNNSILTPFTAYVREHILPPKTSQVTPSPIKYLIDAYSGSGLFTITLAATLPGGSLGIDITEKSITFARANASLNALPESHCAFLTADAASLFASVEFPPAETAVVLDPPRKGCDANFLKQLLAFGPARILYVSCNVHTQARDVGLLVRGMAEAEESGGEVEEEQREGDEDVAKAAGKGSGARYEIESIRGFDFFPQTGHVEGVAVLNRVDTRAVEA